MRAVPSRAETILRRLEEVRHRRPGAREAERAIRDARGLVERDAGDLIRLHDALCFLRAYPHDRRVRDLAERLLATTARRVAALEAAGADLAPFDAPEVAGIAGTTIGTDFSFELVRWLSRRFPRRVRLAWDAGASEERMRSTWPEFLPLLEEEALADANVPYLDWLAAAAGTAPGRARLAARPLRTALGSARPRRRSIRRPRGPDRLGPRRRPGVPDADARAGARAVLSRRAISLAAGRLARRRDVGAPSRAPEALAAGRGAALRPDARGDDGALSRVLHVHARRPDLRPRGAPGTRRRALPRRRSAGEASPAALGLRRLRREERRADRLHRGPRALRAARDRLQHVLHVPGGRVGLDLRPGPEAPPRRPRRDVLLDRSLPARLRERGGSRLRGLLVLPQARLSTDEPRRANAGRAGGGSHRAGPRPSVVTRDVRSASSSAT